MNISFLFSCMEYICSCIIVWFLQGEILRAPWLSALATKFRVIKTGSSEDKTFNNKKKRKASLEINIRNWSTNSDLNENNPGFNSIGIASKRANEIVRYFQFPQTYHKQTFQKSLEILLFCAQRNRSKRVWELLATDVDQVKCGSDGSSVKISL